MNSIDILYILLIYSNITTHLFLFRDNVAIINKNLNYLRSFALLMNGMKMNLYIF